MKVCFFGSYDRSDYNNLLLKLVKLQGHDVYECRSEIKGVWSFFRSYLNLMKYHKHTKYDVMIIPWRGIMTMPLAKLLSRAPIISCPFISVYQTLVEDRKLIKKNSIKDKIIFLIEKISLQIPNLIILDTNANISFFTKNFRVSNNKFRRLLLSVDESIFKPLPIKKNGKFSVLFIGTFIPLHGIDVIIESAKLLSNHNDIQFILVGEGQTRPQIVKMIKKYNLKNVTLHNKVPLSELVNYLSCSDICLGIFDSGKKARTVIPHKILIALGSQKPIITADTSVLEEAGLYHKENIFLIEPKNPQKLADAILTLKEDPNLSEKIAKMGYLTFCKNLSMEVISTKLTEYLNEIKRTSK